MAHTYDHGVLEDGTPYIVMELLEGQSLQCRIKRDGALSLYETSLVVSQAAQALGKAHKKGIVHRDVKPGNLFCVETDYDLFIKLLDFGIAKHADGLNEIELTNSSNLLGSPLYMSPEQYTHAKAVDWRGDLWSLAVVAYRCLTGVPPFHGEGLGQVVMAVMHQDYQPVTKLCPSLPAALDDWFAKAFHPEIEKRFQSAKALATRFAAAARPGIPEARGSFPSITELSPDGQLSDPGVPSKDGEATITDKAPAQASPVSVEATTNEATTTDKASQASPKSVAALPLLHVLPAAQLSEVPARQATFLPESGRAATGWRETTGGDADLGKTTGSDADTVPLPGTWQPGPKPPRYVTARLTKDDAPKVSVPILEDSQDSATFAPASSAITSGRERKPRMGMLAGAAMLLLAGGLSAYAAMGVSQEPLPAAALSAEGPTPDDAEVPAAGEVLSVAPSAPGDEPDVAHEQPEPPDAQRVVTSSSSNVPAAALSASVSNGPLAAPVKQAQPAYSARPMPAQPAGS